MVTFIMDKMFAKLRMCMRASMIANGSNVEQNNN